MSKKTKIDYNTKVLEVKDLRQHFKVGVGSRKMVIKAVDGVSFDVYKREVFGLVGESGCGKTTTGRSIIKLYNITDGIVKYNGRIVGAGLQGHKYRIRKAKEARNNEIINQRPLAKKIKELKDEAENKKIVLKAQIDVLIQKKENEINRINKIISDYDEAVALELHNFETKRNDTMREEKAELDHIRQRDIRKLFKVHNQTLSLIEKKSKSKISYIKSIPGIENELKDKLAEEEIIHQENIKQTIERLINRLGEISPEILAQYEDQIKEGLKIQFKSTVDTKEPEIANKIADIQDKYRDVYQQISVEHQKNLEKIDEKKPDFEGLKQEIKQIKESTSQQVKALNEQISELNKKLKVDIKSAQEHAKENPHLYVDNEEEIEKIRLKYKEIIDEEVRLLKENRYYNKLKETPEERTVRIEKLRVLKEEYKEKIADASPEVIQREKEIYRQKVKEINSQKPSYARNMSTMQMVFQDPIASLNPRMIVRDIISEGLIVRGERDKQLINEKVNKMLEIVGLSPDHATRYPHEFSGGQRQRIGIARALVVDPDFIIADEPISALDVSIQAQIINLLNELKEELGLTILFIAHDLSVVKYFCDRIAVMYYGKIVELASSEELFANPLHPYTKSLLSAIPHPDPDYEAQRTRVLYDPTTHNYLHDKPELVEIKPGHFVHANKEEIAKYQQQLGIK